MSRFDYYRHENEPIEVAFVRVPLTEPPFAHKFVQKTAIRKEVYYRHCSASWIIGRSRRKPAYWNGPDIAVLAEQNFLATGHLRPGCDQHDAWMYLSRTYTPYEGRIFTQAAAPIGVLRTSRVDTDLFRMLQRFCDLDIIGICEPLTNDDYENEGIQLFTEDIKCKNRRYKVAFPWNSPSSFLADNRAVAVR